MNKKQGFGIILVLLFLLGTIIQAGAETIRFSADSVESVLATGKESVRLRGSARVQTNRVEVTADEIVISGDNNRYIDARGSVFVYEKEKDIRLVGDRLFYDRTLDILRITGNAMLDDKRNDIVARAGVIESRGQENLSLIQIGVRILRTDMAARAEIVRYDRNRDILELTGQPVVFFEGDEYRAGRIQVDLKTDDILLEGRVQGTIVERSNE